MASSHVHPEHVDSVPGKDAELICASPVLVDDEQRPMKIARTSLEGKSDLKMHSGQEIAIELNDSNA